MRIAVTGGSGYIGSQLIRLLSREPEVEEIVNIDVSPPRREVEKVRFVKRSVTEDLVPLLADPKRPFDVVAHLAWILDPLRDGARQREICIGGTRRVLEACAIGRPKQLLFMSSATAYGANPEHRTPLDEFCELKDRYHYQYSAEKREAELLCRRFAADHPRTTLQIVRPVAVGGPNVANSIFRTLHRPVVLAPLGYDVDMQLVHEEDVARALLAVIQSGAPGAFNVAGDGLLSLDDTLRLMERRPLKLPFRALYRAADLLWRLGVTSMAELPPGFLYFLVYPWQVSTRRIRDEIGFSFRYSARQVLESYLRSRTWRTADEDADGRRPLKA